MVIDVSDRRAAAAQGDIEQGPRPAMGVVAPSVHHDRSVGVRLFGQLGHQPGLADALWSEHRDKAALSIGDPGPGAPKPSQLGLATDERRTHGLEREWKGPGKRRVRPPRQIELGILGQHGRLESLQRRPGLDAELVDQQPAGPLVGVEGLALPAIAIERQHELAPHPLAERLLGQRGLDLVHQVTGLTRRQVGVETVLVGRQPELLESPGLGRARLDVAELRVPRTAPQTQGDPQRRCRRRVAVPELLGPGASQPLEPERVDDVGVHLEPVAAADRHEHRRRPALVPDRLDNGPQPGDIRRNRALGGARWTPRPDRVDQRVERDDTVGPGQQHGQHRALLRTADGHRRPVPDDLERPKHTELDPAGGRGSARNRARARAHRTYRTLRLPSCRLVVDVVGHGHGSSIGLLQPRCNSASAFRARRSVGGSTPG
jgi:hypothetical protein